MTTSTFTTAPDGLCCDGLLLPPLYRSEGFAEDLPGWDLDSAPALPRAGQPAGRGMVALLFAAPLAAALVGMLSSVKLLA